jgi:hypothetical protein
MEKVSQSSIANKIMAPRFLSTSKLDKQFSKITLLFHQPRGGTDFEKTHSGVDKQKIANA